MNPDREYIAKRLGGENAVWNTLLYDRDGIIEASAGTGKTYALQSIVLKLVSREEEPVSAKNILLVTYTEKAAGELRSRIRDILETAGCLDESFDEMTICTIHSFCRELLGEYAFENRVPMKMDVTSTNIELVHEAVRTVVASEEFARRFGAEFPTLMDSSGIESVEKLVECAERILDTAASKDIPPASAGMHEEAGDAVFLPQALTAMAWPVFKRLKDESSALTFDDLVTQASRAVLAESEKELSGGKSALLESIRRRYRIALVDEFQDTDMAQWRIFERLFSSRHNVLAGGSNPKQGFLLAVGDPKQAIYSFRGADVATYLAAREYLSEGEGAQKMLTLDATFRSTREMIKAFNCIFGELSGWFDGMSEGGKKIEYRDVEYPEGNPKFAGLEDFTGRGPVTLLEALPCKLPDPAPRSGYGNAAMCLPVYLESVAGEIIRLKALPFAFSVQGGEDGAKRVPVPLSYSDMCILVRTNKEAQVVKKALAARGIPFAQYKERGLFLAAEAEALVALFDYLSFPARKGAKEALLLTPIFRIHPSRLAETDSAELALADSLLEKWKAFAEKKDWTRLFDSVIVDSAISKYRPGDYSFRRTLRGFRQILDRLLEVKGRSAVAPGEFASLIRSWRKDDGHLGEDGALRQKEAETDAVQIMTMHASKGLEFAVVFVATGFGKLEKGEENERKRLFYVAITRAACKLYLPWTKWDRHIRCTKKEKGKEEPGIGSISSPLLGEGFLSRGIRALIENDLARLEETIPSNVNAQPLAPPRPTGSVDPAPAPKSPLPLAARRLMWDSFSSLCGPSPEHGEAALETAPVLKTHSLLPRNNISGTVFHEIMEKLCAGDEAKGAPGFAIGQLASPAMAQDNAALRDIILQTMRRNGIRDLEADGDSTSRTLARMVWGALNTEIPVPGEEPFYLKDIGHADRRAELEFVIDESSLFGDDLPKYRSFRRDGLLNGSIDLLVRPRGASGKVVIIDWKTNTLPDYSPSSVQKAMDDAAYHLQYRIYSLAANRWLGEGKTAAIAYLFVRGAVTEEAKCGIFSADMGEAAVATARAETLSAIAKSLAPHI